MLAHRLIERKRDGGRIEPGEWRALILAYVAGHVPDYQMAAFLMASYLRGLDRNETAALTQAMLDSGDRMDTSPLQGPRIDKHSTGGVGDKGSLVLAPLMASMGIVVPMMSGRSLAHTGGTLDKLESIPGFRVDLTMAEARAQLERVGCVMMGQTREIAPADRTLYALRGATATVDDVSLIAASIASKKLAEGLSGLVLDVKRGSGATLPALEPALELAELMIHIGVDHGCPTVALVTAMDRPLGRACGNALEVEEAIQSLRGEGPPDLMALTYALGAEMLMMAGMFADGESARLEMERTIVSGRAATSFADIIEAQGGNPGVVEDPAALPQAAECEVYVASRRGFIGRVEPRAIGRGIVEMGGGRSAMDDLVDPTVGFVITARPGDWVEAGEPLATIFARDRSGIEHGRLALRAAILIADEAEPPLPLISHRVSANGVELYGVV